MKVLQITEQAENQLKEMLDQDDEEHIRLRLGVRDGDCNGFSYSMGFDEDYNQTLDYLDEIKGIPVTIRKTDVKIISGTTIDFKQNMMGGGFTIDNPNSDGSCDCDPAFQKKE